MSDHVLFCTNDLHAVFDDNIESALQVVEEIAADQFEGATDEELVEHVLSRRDIAPLEIFPDEMEMEKAETKADMSHDFRYGGFGDGRKIMVPALALTVSFPFRGDFTLWYCRPSSFTLNPPQAKIRQNQWNGGVGFVDITLIEPSDSIGDGTKIRQDIDKTIEQIRKWVEWIESDVVNHNSNLRQRIGQQVKSRRERLTKHGNVLKAFNIPLKKKQGTSDLVALPMKKKIIRPLPQKPSGPPEHGINEEDYEFILKVIRHEGCSFETTPSTFARHGEEELRDFILAHLNTHYEGQATGETFRKKGKTDIRIEQENRAAFVAECKVWRGPKTVNEAVHQLLGYLTWRDCKASMVFFNTQNAGFKEIQDKLPEALKTHPRFHGELRANDPGEWRFRFMSEDDDNRYVILHVFLFNLYVK